MVGAGINNFASQPPLQTMGTSQDDASSYQHERIPGFRKDLKNKVPFRACFEGGRSA